MSARFSIILGNFDLIIRVFQLLRIQTWSNNHGSFIKQLRNVMLPFIQKVPVHLSVFFLYRIMITMQTVVEYRSFVILL